MSDTLVRARQAEDLLSDAAQSLAQATCLRVPELGTPLQSRAYWEITLRHLMDQLRETMRRELV